MKFSLSISSILMEFFYWISPRNDAMGKGTLDMYNVKDGSSRERRGRSECGVLL